MKYGIHEKMFNKAIKIGKSRGSASTRDWGQLLSFNKLHKVRTGLNFHKKFMKVTAILALLISTIVVSLVIDWFSPVSDTRLDSGGSYNYENCECDYEVRHPYKKLHQCT